MKPYYSVRNILILIFLVCGIIYAKGAETTPSKEKITATLESLNKVELSPIAPRATSGATPLLKDLASSQSSMPLSLSQEDSRELLKRIRDLEETVKKLQIENQETSNKIKELYDHIGKILTQTPPVFKELITTNKILWLMLAYTGYGFVSNSYHAYETLDVPFLGMGMLYVLNSGVSSSVDFFVRSYYVGLVLSGLRTLLAVLPKPAPAKK